MQTIEEAFVETKLLTGNQGNLIKAIVYFIHQALVHADINMYALNYIEEGLCRHPELTVKLIQAFDAKFNPETATSRSMKKSETIYTNSLTTSIQETSSTTPAEKTS